MKTISYKRHRFPPEIIRQAVWLYFKYTLSLRDVEGILAERGIDVSYETVRCWAEKFGGAIAANIRRMRPRPGSVWHLDEMVIPINGRHMFMRRAVDQEGEVLDVLVQKRRNKRAALKLLRKLMRKQGYAPDGIVPDGLASYGAALDSLGGRSRHRPGRLRDKMQRFKSQGEAQRFVATHGAIYNLFNLQRHLISRTTLRTFRADSMAGWMAASVASA